MSEQKVKLCQIENLTQKPISVRLNSGKTLLLAPGVKSPAIEEFEVEHNEKVEKLTKLNVIVVEPEQSTTATQKVTAAEKASSANTKTKSTTGSDAAKENDEAKS